MRSVLAACATRTWRALLCAVALVASTPAHAQQHAREAQAAYQEGKIAYEASRYDTALERFKLSYTLSGQPALLYNIAAALQALNRPGEAADTLRDFLKVRPAIDERPELEARIATLTKAQELIDRDDKRKKQLADEERTRMDLIASAELTRRVQLETEREHKRRLGLAIGIPLGIVVLGGVIAGIVCGLGKCSNAEAHDFDFGKETVTP